MVPFPRGVTLAKWMKQNGGFHGDEDEEVDRGSAGELRDDGGAGEGAAEEPQSWVRRHDLAAGEHRQEERGA